MHNDEIIFNEGEKRELTASVSSKNSGEVVVVASAEFELVDQATEEVVQAGNCEVLGDEAVVFLDLAEKGRYTLKTTLKVGREVIVDTRTVKVL